MAKLLVGGTGRGGGGGGLHFRSPPDIFTGADRAAAETARNTYFTTTMPAALATFQGDQSLAIILRVTGADDVFQTYLPGQSGMAYDATQWEDRTDAVRGPHGPQGRYFIRQYLNAATEPADPVGGTYNVDTGVLTPSAGWAADFTQAPLGQETWFAATEIDPDSQTGDVRVTWGDVGRFSSAGRQGSFLIYMYQNADTRPAAPTGGSYNVEAGTLRAATGWAITPTAPGAGEETWVTEATINPWIQTGAVTPTWQVPYERGAVSSLLTIIDVTGTGPPAASQATIPHLYLDTEIPRAWMTRTQRRYTMQPTGSWNAYSDPGNYLGAFRRVVDVPAFTATQYFYLHGVVHSWYQAIDQFGAAQVSAGQVLGATATWLGDAPDRQTALDRIDNFDNARSYVFFNNDTGDVEVLDNTTYMAQTVNLSYAMIALDLETDVEPWAHAGDTSLIPAGKLDLPNNTDFADLVARVTALEGGETTGTIWFGWSADQTIDTADFANFNSVTNMLEGVLPTTAADAYIVVAVPEMDGEPDGIFVAGGDNGIDGYTRQAGTVNDPNGISTIVLVSDQTQASLLSGSSIRVEFPT